ncbi:MAG: cbb3-type cytochrome oxidase assembly protein CcoS [Planctomycetaceae bacterium]|nr:cbb3-type cytochrome oxidase assembly protein CcoS [Planctomycetaceae bacterium]
MIAVSLLYIWIVMAALALIAIAAALVWAIRHKQFSRQDRAARLPLRSGIPDDDEPAPRPKEDKP